MAPGYEQGMGFLKQSAIDQHVITRHREDDLNQVIDNLRVWITGLLAALATLLLMVGGVRYLLAAGDPGSHERAKGSIKAASRRRRKCCAIG